MRRWRRRTMALCAVLAPPRPSARRRRHPPHRPARSRRPVRSLPGVTVTATQLDDARSSIQPSLGASRYEFTPGVIDAIPQGEQAPLNQVLLRAPGVAQDSFGQIHVRGDHGNLQYRLDGVQLPEGLSLFSNALATQYARNMSLITGALPAQYGFRTAGVVDITLKSGTTDPGAEATMIGGSRDYLQPSLHLRRPLGRDRLLRRPASSCTTASASRTRRRPTSPIHDDTDQWHALGKVTGIIDEQTRRQLHRRRLQARASRSPTIPTRRRPSPSPARPTSTAPCSTSASGRTPTSASLSLQKHYRVGRLPALGLHALFEPRLQARSVRRPDVQRHRAVVEPHEPRRSACRATAAGRSLDNHTLRGGFLVQREHAHQLAPMPRSCRSTPPARRPATSAIGIDPGRRQYRLAVRRLPAGRMEALADRDRELRPALRRGRRHHAGEPAQPAHQRRVAAQRRPDRACRLRALLHAAAARPGQQRRDRRDARHDGGARR